MALQLDFLATDSVRRTRDPPGSCLAPSLYGFTNSSVGRELRLATKSWTVYHVAN